MSEYWKSTPKYWCKHCSTYVKDTPFERKQHENTAKHQNSLKRFLRDIQNSHERGETEKERAKSEVERLKGLAGGDTKGPSSSAQETSKVATSAHKVMTGPTSIVDRKRQWAQLAEMGVKVPEDFRSEVAMAGDWQTLSRKVVDDPLSEAPLSKGIKKRKIEGQEEDEVEKAAAGEAIVRRGWGATTKTYPGQDNTDLDDLLSSSILVKKEKPGSSGLQSKGHDNAPVAQENNPVQTQGESTGANNTAPNADNPADEVPDEAGVVKQESNVTSAPDSMLQVPENVPIPIFKKRRAKAR
ncbi:hypothetical protein H2200_008575 [Cladophialophora chaetospira]|uniref:U1-type domain-containing protein n=1 Tax=Cladophialophora chaetospira TaxID=386627 RepID=A0AA38X4B0_9EURO|nr:hypothetical protein H2200_008575 [Cladophialophora chaetospira]